MGLSSNARLLTITARLTQNEFESQKIANQKLRLSTQSHNAQVEYLDALDSSTLMYTSFDNYGNKMENALTAKSLYQYHSDKNQYVLINTSNQILVPKTDVQNYENSRNLKEFLDKYHVFDGYKETESDKNADYSNYIVEKTKWDNDMAAYKANQKAQQAWDNAELQFQINHKGWVDRKNSYDINYANAQAAYEIDLEKRQNEWDKEYAKFEIEYSRWLEQDRTDLSNIFLKLVTRSEDHEDPETHEHTTVYHTDQPKDCYSNALGGYATCFEHVLNLILDYDGSRGQYGATLSAKSYTPSCGVDENKKPTQNPGTFDTVNLSGGTVYGYSEDVLKEFAHVSALINETNPDGTYKRKCDGVDGNVNSGVNNSLTGKTSETVTALDILSSDYVWDFATGTATDERKSLKQRTIDMYYILVNNLANADKMKEMLVNFVEGDMTYKQTPTPTWNGGDRPENEFKYDDFTEIEPVATHGVRPADLPYPGPAPESPEVDLYPDDAQVLQWYVNLWYRMEGENEVPKIQYVDGTNIIDESYRKDVLDSLKKERYTDDKFYVELDENLANSNSWVTDVLQQGIVVMQKADLNSENPRDKIDWNHIIHTNVKEFTKKDNDELIARAEAKYKKTLSDIESVDKRLQNKIKRLDTEHNALKTEYESIQTLVSKNIERSFKTFG